MFRVVIGKVARLRLGVGTPKRGRANAAKLTRGRASLRACAESLARLANRRTSPLVKSVRTDIACPMANRSVRHLESFYD
jgi:hypothetical protein